MKRLILGGLILSTPITLFAHGNYPAIFSILGYVFILPIFLSIIENIFLVKRYDIGKFGNTAIILINWFITIFGYFGIFYMVELLKIRNEAIVEILSIFLLSTVQIVSKSLIFIFIFRIKTRDMIWLTKIISAETTIVNTIFCLIMLNLK